MDAKTPEQAFLQDILANPDDDAPRLIFADWLEEHGDALRAEFIRVQCELARLAEDDPRLRKLAQRAYRLSLRYEPIWQKTLPEWTGYLRINLERGFGASVNTTARTFLKLATKAMREFPIQEANLDGVADCIEKLCRNPQLARLRSLCLDDYRLNDKNVVCLVGCPKLAGLRRLIIRAHHGIGLRGARALAESPHLSGLVDLVLWVRGFDPDAAAVLRRRFGKGFQLHDE
jgi:uncharacterized protein (TIGR02996 family)